MKDKKNEFKKDLHEWLAEMKARREINRKRDEEQARWDAQFNAPLNLKDRDQDYEERRNGIDKRQWHLEDQVE